MYSVVYCIRCIVYTLYSRIRCIRRRQAGTVRVRSIAVTAAVSRSSERFSIQGTIQRGARQLYTARGWAVVSHLSIVARWQRRPPRWPSSWSGLSFRSMRRPSRTKAGAPLSAHVLATASCRRAHWGCERLLPRGRAGGCTLRASRTCNGSCSLTLTVACCRARR